MRIILWLVTAAAVLAGSFFGTLWFVDQFIPGLGYDVASFPRVIRGQTLTFRNNENRGAVFVVKDFSQGNYFFGLFQNNACRNSQWTVGVKLEAMAHANK